MAQTGKTGSERGDTMRKYVTAAEDYPMEDGELLRSAQEDGRNKRGVLLERTKTTKAGD